jgi:hypothetical protein
LEPTTGGREIAEFFSVGGGRMFAFTHLPSKPAKAAVVICSPVYAEFINNYRREVLLGRRLAELGFAVQRFHYRGQGNSEDETNMTFDSMMEDAEAAGERVRAVTGNLKMAFFGTRFGGLVAAANAARDGSPLAVWDPVLDASEYFREVFRARRIQSLRSGDRASARVADMHELLERDGSIPVLGYEITRGLYETSRHRTLERELGSSPKQALVVSLGTSPRASKTLTDLVRGWRANGCEVENQTLGQRESWWFTSDTTPVRALNRASDLTVDWLARALITGSTTS